jgi:hypothetical protein
MSAVTEVNSGAAWRNHGPFCLAPTGAILPTCPGLSENLFPPRPSSVANGGVNTVPTQGLKWRRGWDSNPR